MQIPLLSGVGANETAEFVQRYPLNLEPVAINSKISKGQLRLAAGATSFAMGPGIDRGGIVWNDACHRVMGTSLVTVNADGSVTALGDVGGEGPISLDYSFDRLAVRSGTSLFYWNGVALSQVTDTDLGNVLDMLWIDGYFMTTDGSYLVVTELSDPTSILPLKYGSAEVDPDPITGLFKVKQSDEVYVLGRHTIQVFENRGGNGFPFAAVKGATIPYGCVSASAKCGLGDSFAFAGSKRDEALGVYVAGSASATKISTRAVDDALAAVDDPASIQLEKRAYRDEQRLLVHLPGETWVYLVNASARVEEQVWYRLASGFGGAYRPRNAVLAYGKFLVGDTESSAIGVLDETADSHFGETFEWALDAGLLYNQGKGAIIDSVELVGPPGRGGEAKLFLSTTEDGEVFSEERALTVVTGDRRKRLVWRLGRRLSNYLGFRFRGYGGLPGFAALEATVRPLS